MALAKQIVTMNMLQTIDTSIGEVVNKQPLNVENLVCNKTGELTKRWGYKEIGLQILGQESVVQNIRYITDRSGELLAFADSGVYKYSGSLNKMIQISRNIVTQVDKTIIIRNNYSQSYAQIEISNNKDLITIYRDSRGGYRYSVLDESTNTILKMDIYIGDIKNPQLVKFNQKIFLFYSRESDKKLLFRQFGSDGFTLLEEQEVEDAVLSSDYIYKIKQVSISAFCIVYVDSNKKVSVGFNDQFGKNLHVRDGFHTRFLIDTICTGNLDFVYKVGLNNYVYVVWETATDISYGKYNILGNAVFLKQLTTHTNIHTSTYSFTENDLFVVWDKSATVPQEYLVYASKWTLEGDNITPEYILTGGVALLSETFIIGGIRYITVSYTSVLQPGVFVVNEFGNVAAKFNRNTAVQHRTEKILIKPYLTDVSVRLPVETQTSFDILKNYAYQKYGISVFSVVYGQKNATSVVLENALYVSGSIVRFYDGNSFTEAGFLLKPEPSMITAESAAVKATGTITSTGSLKFIAKDFGEGGNSIQVSFTTGGNAGNEVVTVNGKTITVQIQSGVSTADNIKTKLEASTQAMALINVEIITSGTMVAPASVTLSGGVGGKLSQGSYLYAVSYIWTDIFGDVHRIGLGKEDSIAVTCQTNDKIKLTIPNLILTDKNDVYIEIYRTEKDGTILYLVDTILNNKNQIYSTYYDSTGDSDLTFIPTYTSGGVLPNEPFPICTCLGAIDGRLVMNDTERPDVYYFTKKKESKGSSLTKTVQGIGFSSYLYDTTGAKGGKIVAFKNLFNSMLVFKESCIGVFTGQYPLPTGKEVSLKYDIISEEIGCISKNAIAEIDLGIVFQSKKGLHILGRDMSIIYIGQQTDEFKKVILTDISVLPDSQTVIFLSDNITSYCYNYIKKVWTTFPTQLGYASTVINDDYYFLTIDDRILKKADNTNTSGGRPVLTKIRTPWIQVNDISGFERLYNIVLQGVIKNEFGFKINIYYDFEDVPRETFLYTSIDLRKYGTNLGTYGVIKFDQKGLLEYIRIQPRYQKCSALSVEISEWYPEGYDPENSITWHSIRLEIGLKRGYNRNNYRIGKSQISV